MIRRAILLKILEAAYKLTEKDTTYRNFPITFYGGNNEEITLSLPYIIGRCCIEITSIYELDEKGG